MEVMVFNLGFSHSDGTNDETQIDVRGKGLAEVSMDVSNTVLSLKDEMDIAHVDYIDFVGREGES